MATATKTTKLVERPVAFDRVDVVTLELSKDEAAFLVDVMDRIGGPAASTRRRYADEISDSLQAAGVRGKGTEDVDAENRAIWFNEKPAGLYARFA